MKYVFLGIAYFLFVTFAPAIFIAWLAPFAIASLIYFVVMTVKSCRK